MREDGYNHFKLIVHFNMSTPSFGLRRFLQQHDFLSARGYFGVKEADISELAKNAMKAERAMVGNPRRITEKDVEEILRKAL